MKRNEDERELSKKFENVRNLLYVLLNFESFELLKKV